MSTMVQHDKAEYDNANQAFDTAITQGKTIAEVQDLRRQLQILSAKASADTIALMNKTKAYTSSLTSATENQGAKDILDAFTLTQTKMIAGAKSNGLLNNLVAAKNTAFQLNTEYAAAQSELTAVKSESQILVAAGELDAENIKYKKILAAGNKLANVKTKLLLANEAVVQAQLSVNMDVNSQAILDKATTTLLAQNAKAESNILMAQYNKRKEVQAKTSADLILATTKYNIAKAAFDTSILEAADITMIKEKRDALTSVGIELTNAKLAETHAMAALNTAIENSNSSQIARALITTARVNDENAVAGANRNTEQYKLDLLLAAITAAESVNTEKAAALVTARNNLTALTTTSSTISVPIELEASNENVTVSESSITFNGNNGTAISTTPYTNIYASFITDSTSDALYIRITDDTSNFLAVTQSPFPYFTTIYYESLYYYSMNIAGVQIYVTIPETLPTFRVEYDGTYIKYYADDTLFYTFTVPTPNTPLYFGVGKTTPGEINSLYVVTTPSGQAGAIPQEIVESLQASAAAATNSSAAQTDLDKKRKAGFAQKEIVDAAAAAFQKTQEAVIANNSINYLLFNGFVFKQSLDRYVLEQINLPSTISEGVDIVLYSQTITPVDVGIYDSTTQYVIGNLISYPDGDGPQYMCLVASQDPRGEEFCRISGADPVSAPSVWIQTQPAQLRYRSSTDLLINAATTFTEQPSIIQASLVNDMSNFQNMFINSDLNGNNTLLNGLIIFGQAQPESNTDSPTTITGTTYMPSGEYGSRNYLDIVASKNFLVANPLPDVYIKNGKTVLEAASLAYNTYITNLANAGFLPNLTLGNLTKSFIDTSKLPGNITAGTPFSIGTTSLTPTDKGVYNASTSYTTADLVTDSYGSIYMCLVGPNSATGINGTISGIPPVESPGSSPYWFIVENNGWETLTYNSETDLTLSITGFGSLLWTSTTYPPNQPLQLDSNFLQGYTVFGTGLLQRTTVTNLDYDYAYGESSYTYSYKLNLDAATSTDSTKTFFVKNGAAPLEASTVAKLCQTLALFMNNAATYASQVILAETNDEVTVKLGSIVDTDLAKLQTVYSGNTTLMPYINSASAIIIQCFKAGYGASTAVNSYLAAVAGENSAAITTASSNKSGVATALAAIQTAVTSAAGYILAQNTTSANSYLSTVTTKVSDINVLVPNTPPQSGITPLSGIKAWFKASEYSGTGAWLDKSGNGKNATVFAGTAAKNSDGNGIVFDGQTGWQFPNPAVGNSWTTNVWVKDTGSSGEYCILVQRSNGPAMNVLITNAIYGGTRITSGYYAPTNGFNNLSSPIQININEWKNIQTTWDGLTLNTYVNGALASAIPYYHPSVDNGGVYNIGARWDEPYYMTGEIGEVRVYDRPLTQAEVVSIYNESRDTYLSIPNIYLRAINYSGSGAWNDESESGNHATLENGTIAKNTQGNGIVLDGSTSWIFPNVGVSNRWTANVWFKNTANHGSSACILTQKFGYSYQMNCMIGDASETWGGTTKVAGSFVNGPAAIGTQITLVNNVWTNIQIVYNGTQIITYINGTLLGSTTPAITAADSGLGYIIGRSWGGGSYMVGEIGELRIYNKALSASQVTSAYNESLATFSS